jgi:MYB-related transcription factor LHY
MSTLGKNTLSIDVHKDAKEINDCEMERLNGIHISSKSDRPHEDYLDTSTQEMNLKSMSVDTAYVGRQTAKTSHSVTEKNGATSILVTGSNGSHPVQTSDQEGANGRMNPCIHPTLSVDPKFNINATPLPCPRNYSAFPSMMQCNCNQDAYRYFINMSSTFSSMLVSTLLSNPAIHAAGRLAASYWLAAEINTSVNRNQENPTEGVQGSSIGSPPSMASMVAATVAAASAWWETQGLFPIFAPPMAFPFVPASTAAFPMADVRASEKSRDCQVENAQKECQEAQNQNQFESLRVASPSESDGSRKGDLSLQTELKISPVQNADTTPTTVADTSDAFRNKKKQDRSSCGSNTPSSSDVEADNIPEKQDKANDNVKQASCSNSSDTNNRRFRSSGSTSDSWKEVSEEVYNLLTSCKFTSINLFAYIIAFLIHISVVRVVWLLMHSSVEKSFPRAFLLFKEKNQRVFPRRKMK